MMAQRLAVWHGSDLDLRALRIAVEHNCTCVQGEFTCAGHDMLSDQNILDHLVFVAGRRSSYCHGEFDPVSEWF